MRTTFTTTVNGSKVESTVSLPDSLEEWLATGFTEADLLALIFHAWKVVEAQPELRAEKVTDPKAASKLAQQRIKAGPRERQARGQAARQRKANELLEQGYSAKEVEMYFAMQDALK